MLNSVRQGNGSLAEQTARQLEEMIRRREYKPEDKIPTEPELSKELNVSRSTVREAVKLLAAQNLLEIRRGRGTYVTRHPGRMQDPLGLSYMTDNKWKLTTDLLAVRRVLEPWMAAEAARCATAEDIEKIVESCNEVEELIRAGKPHSDADVRFHTSIAYSTKNSVMPSLIPIINRGVPLFVDMTANSLLEETIMTHREVTHAIAAHDPETARRAMEHHITCNQESMENRREKEEEKKMKKGGSATTGRKARTKAKE